MRSIFLKVHRFYGKALWAAAMLAGFLTFAIMCVIDLNAVLRKLVNWPLPAALEITQSLLVGAIMLPFAYTLLKRQHVNTVFFTSMLPTDTFFTTCGKKPETSRPSESIAVTLFMPSSFSCM